MRGDGWLIEFRTRRFGNQTSIAATRSDRNLSESDSRKSSTQLLSIRGGEGPRHFPRISGLPKKFDNPRGNLLDYLRNSGHK